MVVVRQAQAVRDGGAVVATRKAPSLRVTRFGCEALEGMEPHALGATYWFEAAPDGEPYSVSVRFTGRRIGVRGKPGRRDSFSVVETIDQVVPGTGRIAFTARIPNVAPGEWHVTAAPVKDPRPLGVDRRTGSVRRGSLPSGSSSGPTGWAPVIRVQAPGARLGAWPALVSVGVVVALVFQRLLAARADLPTGRVLLVSLLASLVGLVSAKLYYLVEHRGRPQSLVAAGLCIQGFVLGAIGTLVVGALVAGVPAGRLLDVTVPGLLFAMTIGRFGCFFGGCCAGRPTSSRWGLWSSDRHVGVRRIPTQLLESLLALGVGLAALLAVWDGSPDPAGVVFVGSLAAYTLGRQLLFPLRDLPRHTSHGRQLTAVVAGAVLAAAVVVGLLF